VYIDFKKEICICRLPGQAAEGDPQRHLRIVSGAVTGITPSPPQI